LFGNNKAFQLHFYSSFEFGNIFTKYLKKGSNQNYKIKTNLKCFINFSNIMKVSFQKLVGMKKSFRLQNSPSFEFPLIFAKHPKMAIIKIIE
jgi:hypothetical protein